MSVSAFKLNPLVRHKICVHQKLTFEEIGGTQVNVSETLYFMWAITK